MKKIVHFYTKTKEKLLYVNNFLTSEILKFFHYVESQANQLLQIYVAITIVLIGELFTDNITISCLLGFAIGLYKEYLDERYGNGKDLKDLSRYSIGIVLAVIYLNLLKHF